MSAPQTPDTPGVDARAARRFFRRSAGGGDALAQEVERRMAERLDLVRLQPARILDVGSGSGAGLAALGMRYPKAELVALDSAHEMLLRAQPRRSLFDLAKSFLFSSESERQAVCADFARMPFAPRSIQLLWSNLALAWAADPLQALREFSRVLDVGGLLMFSTYGPDTLKELRAAFATVDDAPHVMRFIDMHDLGDMLVMAGFAEPVMDMEIITLTYADIDALVRDLRNQGQQNADSLRSRGLLGRNAWSRLRSSYELMRRDGRLPATVEIIYGHAWRVAPRMTEDGRSIIRIDGKPGA